MPESQTDSAETRRLLEQVEQGGPQAIGRLLGRHREYLRRVITLRWGGELRPRIDLDDVLQETQLVAIRHLDDYLRRRPMPFRLWLRKTAQQRMVTLWRRHGKASRRSMRREVALPDRSSQVFARQLLAKGPTPAQHAQQQELAAHVRKGIARLPQADQEIILMRNFEGLSNQDIGLMLDLTPATVSKRHGRALVRLRSILLKLGLDEFAP